MSLRILGHSIPHSRTTYERDFKILHAGICLNFHYQMEGGTWLPEFKEFWLGWTYNSPNVVPSKILKFLGTHWWHLKNLKGQSIISKASLWNSTNQTKNSRNLTSVRSFINQTKNSINLRSVSCFSGRGIAFHPGVPGMNYQSTFEQCI